MSGMNEVVELPNGFQGLFFLDEVVLKGNSWSGKLHCGFCDGKYDVSWLTATAESMVHGVRTLHLDACPRRGKVNSFPLTVYDGEGGPTYSIPMRL